MRRNWSRIFLFLATTFSVVVLLAEPARATLMSYVFTGEVTQAQYSLPDMQVGTPVVFTALIDFSGEPSPSGLAGRDEGVWGIDYFYAQYVSGPSFFANRDLASFNNNFGYGVDSPLGWMTGIQGSLFADAASGSDFGDSPLKIYNMEKTVSQWVLGDMLLGSDNLGVYGSIDYELKLTGIEAVNPVPEPSTLLFLGSGVIGLWGLKRRFRN